MVGNLTYKSKINEEVVLNAVIKAWEVCFVSVKLGHADHDSTQLAHCERYSRLLPPSTVYFQGGSKS